MTGYMNTWFYTKLDVEIYIRLDARLYTKLCDPL